jgi:6-phosphogluconolactonase
VQVRAFPTARDLGAAAADAVAGAAEASVRARGRFTVALAGGTTPRLAYERLAAEPLRGRIDWARTDVFFGDERGVAPDHPESNYRMAREALLDRVPIPADRVHRIRGEDDLDAAARAYEAEVARVFGIAPGGPPPAFDLVLLGMGPDGHTASLFPGSPALGETRRWFVAVEGPKPPFARVTATLPVLGAAAEVFFLVTGADKAGTLAAVAGRPGPEPLPAARVAHDRAVVFADEAAASRLAPAGSGRS